LCDIRRGNGEYTACHYRSYVLMVWLYLIKKIIYVFTLESLLNYRKGIINLSKP
jgi:hypothetical protein